MVTENTDDLLNVVEADTVTIETTDGHTFEVECVSYVKQHTAHCGELHIWQFEGDCNATVSFTEGDAEADYPTFPVHDEVWDSDEEESLGYIESLSIVG